MSKVWFAVAGFGKTLWHLTTPLTNGQAWNKTKPPMPEAAQQAGAVWVLMDVQEPSRDAGRVPEGFEWPCDHRDCVVPCTKVARNT